MPTQYPLVNRQEYEHSAARLIFDGEEYIGVTSIDYSSELKKTKVFGTRPQALGITRGKHEASWSFEMTKREGDAFLAKIGDGYGEKIFSVVCNYGNGEDITTDEILSAWIEKASDSSTGEGVLMTKFDCGCLDVKKNGKSIVANSIY